MIAAGYFALPPRLRGARRVRGPDWPLASASGRVRRRSTGLLSTQASSQTKNVRGRFFAFFLLLSDRWPSGGVCGGIFFALRRRLQSREDLHHGGPPRRRGQVVGARVLVAVCLDHAGVVTSARAGGPPGACGAGLVDRPTRSSTGSAQDPEDHRHQRLGRAGGGRAVSTKCYRASTGRAA